MGHPADVAQSDVTGGAAAGLGHALAQPFGSKILNGCGGCVTAPPDHHAGPCGSSGPWWPICRSADASACLVRALGERRQSGLTDSPPHSSGATSVSVCENVQCCPAGSCPPSCPPPNPMPVPSIRIPA